MRLGGVTQSSMYRHGNIDIPVSQTLTRVELANQWQALVRLAEVVRKAVFAPIVRKTALQVVSKCQSRDDDCELYAIFDAVKYGTPFAPPLARGFKYVADTPLSDVFTSPRILLENCLQGACGDDCDGHAAMNAALASVIGFTVGVEAWGPGKPGDPLIHVYGIVKSPKRAPYKEIIVMDTSVATSTLAWRPPGGHTMTAWLNP
jgi:hypothetical protein